MVKCKHFSGEIKSRDERDKTERRRGETLRDDKKGKELVSEVAKAQSESRPDGAERYNQACSCCWRLLTAGLER